MTTATTTSTENVVSDLFKVQTTNAVDSLIFEDDSVRLINDARFPTTTTNFNPAESKFLTALLKETFRYYGYLKLSVTVRSVKPKEGSTVGKQKYIEVKCNENKDCPFYFNILNDKGGIISPEIKPHNHKVKEDIKRVPMHHNSDFKMKVDFEMELEEFTLELIENPDTKLTPKYLVALIKQKYESKVAVEPRVAGIDVEALVRRVRDRDGREKERLYGDTNEVKATIEFLNKEGIPHSAHYSTDAARTPQAVAWVPTDALGDVFPRHVRSITMDTTFGTNNKGLPLLTMCAHNCNSHIVPVMHAVVLNETTELFRWALEAYVKFRGMTQLSYVGCDATRELETIYTDDDAAMAAAIRGVLPHTLHRLCVFHKMLNLKTNFHKAKKRSRLQHEVAAEAEREDGEDGAHGMFPWKKKQRQDSFTTEPTEDTEAEPDSSLCPLWALW